MFFLVGKKFFLVAKDLYADVDRFFKGDIAIFIENKECFCYRCNDLSFSI